MRRKTHPSASRLALVVVVHRETIGRRIAEQRNALGLSQEVLAERIGVRAQTVSRWERGKNLGRITNLDRVAEALEITVADLMAELDADPTAGPLDELNDTKPDYITELREQLARIEADVAALVAESDAAAVDPDQVREREPKTKPRDARDRKASGS